MRSGNRFWKSVYPDIPFTQIARALEPEVCAALL